MDFCETRLELFDAFFKLTTSLAAVHNTLLSASVDFNVYSFGNARREIASSVQLELAALRHVKKMTCQDLRTVVLPVPHCYSYMTIFPSTGRILADYMPVRTAFSVARVSMIVFLWSFSISFTIFCRQWQLSIKHPQPFFRGTHGRFLHIVPTLNDDDSGVATAFLYVTYAEFLSPKILACDGLARSDTETNSCIPSPNTLYPDVIHVYTSAT